MSDAPPRVRLFAALDVPRDVVSELTRWSRDVAGSVEGLRLLPPESFHVTLCFLGWREAGEAERIGRVVERCAARATGLALDGAAWFPPRRPRVLSAAIADTRGELGDLQARLSAALAEEAGYEPEHRVYNPHVTVARVRGDTRLRRAPELDPPAPLPFDGTAVTLYRSLRGGGAARYEPVTRVGL
ncbi:MAG: 2,3-cyclic 3-phosphodiesterase [Solirubrobacteraceae bacterium]|nr:2,3-cyclic 3-phosphodiesterase [Solirubrobacteraceae bacterium]